MSLPTMRPTTRPEVEPAMASVSLACGITESVMRSRRLLDGRTQPRVDHGVENVDDQVDGDKDQRHHQKVGCHDRYIDVLHGLHEQQSHPGPLEYGFGDDRKSN